MVMAPEVEPPATMFSGVGELTEHEASLPPATVLGNHRKTIQTWLGSLSPEDLEKQVELAHNHESLEDFMTQKFGDDKEFGENPRDDLCKFEMWLKKQAYREMLVAKHEHAKALPKPSATAAPEAPKAEVPKRADPAPKRASRESGKGKGTEQSEKFVPLELSDAEKEAYGSFWNKFDKKNGSPNTPTTTAPTSQQSPTSVSNGSESTGLTPECRRKLTLESPAGQIVFIAIVFSQITMNISIPRANILQFHYGMFGLVCVQPCPIDTGFPGLGLPCRTYEWGHQGS